LNKDTLEALNPSQRDAVTAPDGPLLVLAGAGSGKTRAIAHRIAYLIRERGVAPWTILSLTFTNKAAAEMRTRVSALVGGEAPDLWIFTFHALGLRLLRRFATEIGLPADFTVYDEEDRRAVIRRTIRELGFLDRDYPAWRVAGAVSARKNAAFSSGGYHRWQNARDQEVLEKVTARYQELLEKDKGVDFDDLLLRSVALFECSEQARLFAERRFQHVLVDEYQDTNRVQYRLLKHLAPHGNLFVVGDEDQSIYNFRGADLRNILDFERDFPSTTVIKLEQNYRSTASILEAAGALISKNRERKGKRLRPVHEGGRHPGVFAAVDDKEEASYVANRVKPLLDESLRVAVLYRTNAQSRMFEEEFVHRRIPHLLVGGQRFYERREIKDALAYLRLLRNPEDNVSFLRVVNVPARGIGKTTVSLLQESAERSGLSLYDTTTRLLDEGTLPARAHKGLASFIEVIDSLAGRVSKSSVAELVDATLTRSQLSLSFQKESPVQRETRTENLAQLVTAAADYQSRNAESALEGFLDNVSLLTDLDMVKSDAPCVLMTLHGAKGLEFDAVFLTGLEEGLFPHTLSIGSPSSVEEERRLCYVGMTRARNQLTLTYAQSRRAALQQTDREPSRFLSEIPPKLLDWGAGEPAPPKEKPPMRPGGRFRKGMVVRHALFGQGTIVEVDSAGKDQKLTVLFRNAGRKKIMTHYADLEILRKSR
jgi:DNA helicase-2/ATP-dependent DNA helicase PcrA